jgi:aspartate-semialdehyde dehydrogenase
MKLGIIGISGLVGQNILKSLDLLNIQFNKLFLFGFSTVGHTINFRDINYDILEFDCAYLDQLDYIILAVDNNIAKDIIDYHKNNSCSATVIDNSSEYRLDKNVPLIVPEINGNLLKKQKIIANPNCSTTMLVMLLKPLLDICHIDKVIVSTYQAASGAGKVGLDELIDQSCNYKIGEIKTDYWKKQYIFNIFSHNSKIDLDNKYNQEELKMVRETCKILNRYIKINPTCIRVPTLRSHCLSVNVQFNKQVTSMQIFNALENFPGLKILNDESNNQFPEPVITSDKSDIYVGRIRPEYGIDYQDLTNWSFFVSGDQLLKGAAYNSVQILKSII